MLRLTLNPQPLQLRLEALADRLTNLEGVLARIVPLVTRTIERNFDEEGRPLPWPPLAPATLRRKPPGLRILQRTGRLRRSIRTRVEGNAVVASTDLPYAAAHQFGLSRAPKAFGARGGSRRRLPARPFLVLTREDQSEVSRALAEAIEDTVHDSRFPVPER